MKKRKGKSIALLAGIGVLSIVGLAGGWCWEEFRAWYIGYKFIWTGEGVIPSSINASGQVAVNRQFDRRRPEAGHWSAGHNIFVSLGTLPSGDPRTRTSVINDHGFIIGSVYRGGDHLARAFFWSEEDGMREMETLGGQQIAPIDLNNENQVVGWSHPPGRGDPWRAFLWSPDGGIKDLGSLLGGRESQALAINNLGWVVGNVDASGGSMRPFVWKPESGMKELGLKPGYNGGSARDVNDRGEVLVDLIKPGPTAGQMHYILGTPFLWTEDDLFVELPVPEGYNDVRGEAINNRGLVLLRATNRPRGDTAGYLVDGGELKRLPDAIENGLTYYHDINDRGWLAGGWEPMGNEGKPLTRGFLAKPVW